MSGSLGSSNVNTEEDTVLKVYCAKSKASRRRSLKASTSHHRILTYSSTRFDGENIVLRQPKQHSYM